MTAVTLALNTAAIVQRRRYRWSTESKEESKCNANLHFLWLSAKDQLIGQSHFTQYSLKQ